MTDQIRALIQYPTKLPSQKGTKDWSSYDWQEYRSLRNKITIKEAKREYYSNLIQENKNHSSKLWNAIKSAVGSDVSVRFKLLDLSFVQFFHARLLYDSITRA